MSSGRNPLRDDESKVLIRRIAGLALGYYTAGRFGLDLAHYHDSATLVWPPTGIALAALILYGIRLWPGVFLGTLLLAGAPQGASGLAALGIAVGNTLEAVVGATLLNRLAGFRPTLERVLDVGALLLIGALGCTVVSATIGVGTLAVTGNLGGANPWLLWLLWWLGGAGGAIIMAPAVLAAAKGTPPWRTLVRKAEFWIAIAMIVALSAWSVSGAVTGPSGFVAVFTPFPLVVWAGVRLGSRGAVLASFSIMLIATLATARDLSPFVVEGTHRSMMLLWTYGITIGATALTLAATIGQRDRAEQRYRSEEAQRLRAERAQLLMRERERITREMHDGLGGQLVTTISMVERGRSNRAAVLESLRRALDDMRIVIDTLDPSTTDLQTSLGKLRARLEPMLRRNGVRLRWTVADEPALDAFSPEESLHVLRIIQEAVTNAVQHAGAEEIEVRVSTTDGRRRTLSIEIRDDGHGPPEELNAAGRGIRNMKARAEALGGEVELAAGDPGTRVRIRIPTR